MTDARNAYPRLCWGCLNVIEEYAHDHANLNYGGVCDTCAEKSAGDLPGLVPVLRGCSERMNSIIERDDLLQEVKAYCGVQS